MQYKHLQQYQGISQGIISIKVQNEIAIYWNWKHTTLRAMRGDQPTPSSEPHIVIQPGRILGTHWPYTDIRLPATDAAIN